MPVKLVVIYLLPTVGSPFDVFGEVTRGYSLPCRLLSEIEMGPSPQATRRVECAGSEVLQLSVGTDDGTDGPFNPKMLAERVGFEPTLPFRVNTLSKRAPSATRPSLPVKELC